MNSYLLTLYRQAAPEVIRDLQNNHSRAPLLLRLINFLEKQKEDDFTNNAVVGSLYGVEQINTNFAEYLNKYYKLRKKLIDVLKTNSTPPNLIDKVGTLIYEIEFTNKHNLYWGKMQETLEDFENKLWENNLFEFVEKLLRVWIFKNTMYTNFKIYPLISRRRKAIELMNDIASMENIFFEMNDLLNRYGSKIIIDYIDKLKYFYIKNKQYPRFGLLYNYICLRSKLDLVSTVNNQLVNKHLNYLKRVSSKNPNIPIYFYGSNVKRSNKILLINQEISFAWNNRDAAKTEKLFEEKLSFMEDKTLLENSEFRGNDFIGIINAKIFVHNFSEAWRYSDLYQKYLERHIPTSIHWGYLKKAEIVCFAFPVIVIKDYSYLISALETYIQTNSKSRNHIYFKLIVFVLAKLNLLKRNFRSAKRLVSREEVRFLLNSYKGYDLFVTVFNKICNNDYSSYETTVRELEKKIFSIKNNDQLLEYEWIKRVYINMYDFFSNKK